MEISWLPGALLGAINPSAHQPWLLPELGLCHIIMGEHAECDSAGPEPVLACHLRVTPPFQVSLLIWWQGRAVLALVPPEAE